MARNYTAKSETRDKAPGQVLEMPLLPLFDMVLFPQNITPLFLTKRQAIAAVDLAYKSKSREIFITLARVSSEQTVKSIKDVEIVGVICQIDEKIRIPSGEIKILVNCQERARLQYLEKIDSLLHASVVQLTDPPGDKAHVKACVALIRGGIQELLDNGFKAAALTPEILDSIQKITDPLFMGYILVSRLPVPARAKQRVLDIDDTAQRLEEIYSLLSYLNSTTKLERSINARVRAAMEKSQREYYLTEQLKIINKELGRDTDPQEDLNRLERRLKEKDMPAYALERGLSEVRKLRGMTTMAPEYTILLTYIEWILDLPWNKMGDVNINIAQAKKILDANHYGIERPKERILEFLAVQKLSKQIRGPILCLVGPPGVGKTSLAKSVAEATGREYLRLSLGGVRDEAEIRGHRRTYVGALPGKIIQSLKRVKTSNPLFCLDEVDKMTSTERGDPAAALLEVLDPEQNCTYMDHYLDLDYDLSKIFFVTTANSLDAIPAPLLDRMEVVELHSYLETEKFHIARNFLIPRQAAENSIRPENLEVRDDTLTTIIREYTAEAGVRSLERRIAKLCRRTATQMLEHNDMALKFAPEPGDMPAIFGASTRRHDKKEEQPGVGVCTGLAWTHLGGEILFVETGIMSGTGVVSTTGKLGEVMQESARAALSYVRAHAGELGLAPDFHKKIDIHVHVPDGATPKDGPSAGITIATAVTSALLNIPVRNDVAMTGEISLRGRVLPVGGLREKLLAARRAGIMRVILPKENQRDLLDVPDEIKDGMELLFVEHVNEVLPLALNAAREEIFSGAKEDPLYKTLRADFTAADAKAGRTGRRGRTAGTADKPARSRTKAADKATGKV